MYFLRVLLVTFLFVSFLHSQTINVAIASNVSYAMQDIVKAFQAQNPNVKIRTIIGSSGKLTAQIKHNAPFDIFMSANMLYPNTLFADGLSATKPKVYAQGSLALLHVKGSNPTSLKTLLTSAHVNKIAIANPQTAPYGKAAFEVLVKLGVHVKKKLVYAESISQTLSYGLKVTDLAFVAKSALLSPKLKHLQKDKHWSEVDAKLYTPIKQGVVLLKRAQNNASAEMFYDFIFTKKAQKIFNDFGYTTPCIN